MDTLKNTKWHINTTDMSIFDQSVNTVTFVIDFKSNNINFNSVQFVYGDDIYTIVYNSSGPNYIVYDNTNAELEDNDYWADIAFKDVEIARKQTSNENDAENEQLIEWFTTNAEQIIEPPQPNRVEITFYDNADLTGTPIVTKIFDATKLTELNYTKNSTANADSISFEIASQSGSISMFDKDDYTFQELQEQGYLSYNEVKIYKNGVEDAIMYLYSPQKDINSIQWQFTLSDLFGKYKEKQFLGLGYGANTARNCLNAVLGEGNYQLVGIGANDEYLDAQIPNCYLLPDTMWNTLNKICAFALLQGYVVDGIPTFRRSL